jgi:hypothetical protein
MASLDLSMLDPALSIGSKSLCEVIARKIGDRRGEEINSATWGVVTV